MRKRRLGRTGYQVGELGYGTWGVGGGGWRGVEPADAQRALYDAVTMGVDFIDTALAYGHGLAERLIGEVVRDLRARDQVVVATKVPPADGNWPAAPEAPLANAFPAQHVQRSVESSLRHLRLEAIPIVQLHVWHDAWLASTAWPELEGTMARLVREGKVLHWGISANDHDPDHATAILDVPIIETVQVIYNIFDPTPRRALWAKAKERDAAVIVRCPLDEGALGGKLGAGTTFPRHDWRGRYFRDDRLAELAPRLARLAELVETTPPAARSTEEGKREAEAAEKRRRQPEAVTVAELALRFSLQPDEVSVIIPGMRTKEHVLANLAVSDGRKLSAAMVATLAEHAWEKNWYP